MIRAVIFDMDGVITDSERVGFGTVIEAGRRQGFEISESFIRGTLGMKFDTSEPLYTTAYPGINLPRLYADFRALMLELAARKEIPLMRGVPEILDALDEMRIPRAVASSSAVELIRAYLEPHGVFSRFTEIVSGEFIPRSKPEPDIFLHAAARLNAAPSETLIIEDSVNGIRAARASGAMSVMVPDQVPYTDDLAPYVDHVCVSLLDVIPIIRAGVRG